MAPTLQGSVLVLNLYDACEEIQLDALREIFGARPVERSFKHAAPEYVRFERPPFVEDLGAIYLESGEQFQAQVKYYDYGILSVVFEMPFSGNWDTLVLLAGRWMADPAFERVSTRIAREKVDRAEKALVRRYKEWLTEDYFIFQLREVAGSPTANTLLAECGQEIAQVVRGETSVLSDAERNEVLQSSISYYPKDLAVIGWNASLIYDTAQGAETAIQLLEYANSQLLEFRHYDELLTRELAGVYETLKRGAGVLGRWRMAREAQRLQAVTVEVNELVERVDNAIKFLSDMYSARLYRLAAAKVGVPDYKNLVNQKMQTAESLYRSLVEQFHQGRAFALELMVVIILVIELFYLFKGK